MEVTTILLILSIIFISTLIRSTLGFGDALIAMPLLALLIGLKTATPLVGLISTSIGIPILIRNWNLIDLKSIWQFIIAAFGGIILGVLFLKGTSEAIMKPILGLVVVGAGIYNLIKPPVKPTIKSGWITFIFGFVAGMLGAAYNTSGPAIVIYGSLQKWSTEQFRVMLQGYSLPIGLLVIISHGLAGLWTVSIWQLYILALPIMAIAIFLGGKLNKLVPQKQFKQVVNLTLILIGITLIN